MRKVYYLSTCDTCARIMANLPDINSFEQIDIKVSNISEDDLDIAARVAGSYEQVFSKRARKYRSEGWNQKMLSEQDYKKLILKEYTFLKRPVFFVDDRVFIGNSKKEIAALNDFLNK